MAQVVLGPEPVFGIEGEYWSDYESGSKYDWMNYPIFESDPEEDEEMELKHSDEEAVFQQIEEVSGGAINENG